MACVTLVRVDCLTFGSELTTLDTVFIETPAKAATSTIVTAGFEAFFFDCSATTFPSVTTSQYFKATTKLETI
jgi:hypothetical protein